MFFVPVGARGVFSLINETFSPVERTSHKSQREDGSGGEPEGRATASVACEPTAGISVRGCFTAAGQRAPARAARVAIGGGGRASLA